MSCKYVFKSGENEGLRCPVIPRGKGPEKALYCSKHVPRCNVTEEYIKNVRTEEIKPYNIVNEYIPIPTNPNDLPDFTKDIKDSITRLNKLLENTEKAITSQKKPAKKKKKAN